MPRWKKSKLKTKPKARNARRNGPNRPISDIVHTNTNIEVHFKAVLKATFSSNKASVALDSELFHLTAELGTIYKLYRFTKLNMVFQAPEGVTDGVAMNYIPALDEAPSVPTLLTNFSGPATGYYEDGRGTPYHYNIPSTVLNAMPYNWYNTSSNDPEASDKIQGYWVAASESMASKVIYILCDVTCEFQTLEDPNLISSNIRNQVIRDLAGDKDHVKEKREKSNSRLSLA
jgi:hypothetical protein